MSRKSLLRGAVIASLSCASLFAQGSKVAIISIQDAISRTQEGQQLIKQLQDRYAPRSKDLQVKQNGIETLRAQLNKGANTMSDEARRELVRKIQRKEREMQRASEDARGEFAQEQQKIFQDVGGKLMMALDTYSKQNGIDVVFDISQQNSPVLYAVNEVNITNEIIKLYDEQNPVASEAPAAAADSGAAAKPAQ